MIWDQNCTKSVTRSRGAAKLYGIKAMSTEQYLTTAGGKIRCRRCQAMSKRSKQQCGAPAMRGKRVCRIHGGKSTGPVTKRGRERCAVAKTVHGRETRAIRDKRSKKLAELKLLAKLANIE